ncbi:CMRF35-like molecule 8 [Brachyistius frenatus]|uniref:CMRF35-like molecule 8 n=1 Tax=Brachyistius frenatus TaxID=100188 RepID=UPI0037E80D73
MEKINESYIACLTEIHLHILNWDDVTTMHFTYPASKTAVITCNYSLANADNGKFLCKGENPLDCKKLIHTTERAVKGKFDIKDNKRLRYFNVHIANLGRDDSGTYWCGSGRTEQRDQYTKIHLSVAETHVRTKKSDAKLRKRKEESQQELSEEDSNEERNEESNEERNGEPDEERNGEPDEERNGEPSPNKPNVGLIAGIVVGLAVVMAVVIVLILYKRPPACCAAGGSSEQSTNTGHPTERNIGDNQYEEINLQNQPASSLPSVYATVNAPVDPLHYASVSFQKDGNAPPDANKSGDSALVIGRALGDGQSAAAETSLYSTVSTPGSQ